MNRGTAAVFGRPRSGCAASEPGTNVNRSLGAVQAYAIALSLDGDLVRVPLADGFGRLAGREPKRVDRCRLVDRCSVIGRPS